LGRAGRELVAQQYPLSREIDGYRDVYRPLIPVPAWPACRPPTGWASSGEIADSASSAFEQLREWPQRVSGCLWQPTCRSHRV